ncbi:hypothetical protein E5F05_16890 [Deinococcus metallilatus]|uniref:Uncharacterized protein n=1 Tax=Deinococcus metallilatus TaxID=1211322 RepID=A0AAJ5F9Q9_9DEIO|nr:hypothetical protein [Deinococcus metallilatus]MBB5294812.1 hypothetical protein [Deinococcus metallilatus]QBY09468.1 hypothetical protein E5F05_16890 [Deinococcus metallilatus]RXJ09473.1 hypothetical protein ERJ73_15730 [Deinococcus metallilatus]TLK28995.1 hypothetical protein FCS05_07495 [Deinococcus metallilatus]GMA16738.1 hypothetical protein GCM10025871_30690 [Deinococcus metallilatus]
MPETNLTMIGPDGRAGTLTPQQQALLQAAQAQLQADPQFQQLQRPTLSRVEVNGGLVPTDPGYLYLRYDVPGAVPQEFWAHYGSQNHVAWKSGQVTVKQA